MDAGKSPVSFPFLLFSLTCSLKLCKRQIMLYVNVKRLTKERCYNRQEASSCSHLQDRLVHKTQLFTMSVQVVTESQSLRAAKPTLIIGRHMRFRIWETEGSLEKVECGAKVQNSISRQGVSRWKNSQPIHKKGAYSPLAIPCPHSSQGHRR